MNCAARARSEGRCRGMNETGNGPRRQFELGTDGPGAIVVGIDRSTPSLRAAASAAGLARRQRTRLVAVYARTQPTALLSLADHTGSAITGAIDAQDGSEAQLRDVADSESRKWDIDARLSCGRATRSATPTRSTRSTLARE